MGFAFTYKIQDKTDKSLVYYGSSKLPTLDERIKHHIGKYTTWKNNNNNEYCYSFKVLEKDNYEYTIIDKVYVDTDFELREYERKLIENNECVNHNVPNRTKVEYRKVHYQANREKEIERSKQYYQDNKEKQIQYGREWRAKNKEKEKERRKKKFNCECGGTFTLKHKAKHLKTNKHQKWLCQTIA
jgi:hypothetical protein